MENSSRVPGKAAETALAGIGVVLKTISRLLLAPIVLMILVAGLSNFKDANQYPLIRRTIALEEAFARPLTAAVKTVVPTNFRGVDVSRWIAAVFLYLLSVSLGYAGAQASVQSILIADRRESAKKDKLSALSGDLDRDKLLEIYTQAKRTLEAQKRPLAFLSIDVVDSTGIKVGEDTGVAERDFKLYKRLVEKAVTAHNPLKSTWTPDGVMICFSGADAAVETARELLEGLVDFNHNVKAIKKDFAVRIGLNAGEVHFDEGTRMEEMNDRVIDIAGHLQKHGSKNAISVPKPVAEVLLAKHPFKSAHRTVDGLEVYEWAP